MKNVLETVLFSRRHTFPLSPAPLRAIRTHPQIESQYHLEALEPRVLMTVGGVPMSDTYFSPLIRPIPGGVVIASDLTDSSGIYLTKLNDDGTPDPTFGNADGATIINGVGPVDQMLPLPDGKLLVLTDGPLWGSARLFRFDAGGHLDSSFGDGGQVILPGAAGDWLDQSGDLSIAPDGKIVVVAKVDDGDPYGAYDLMFYRLSADGQPDATFGDGGEARVPCSDDFWWAGGARGNSDGSVSASALAFDLSTYIVKLDSRGDPFPGFGNAGVVIEKGTLYSQANFELMTDGTLLVTDYGTTHGLIVARQTIDGRPVTSFGDIGKATVLGGGFPQTQWYGTIEFPDEKLLFFAMLDSPTTFSIVAANADGSLDTTFGGGAGYVHLPHPDNTYQRNGAWDADVDDRGRIIYLTPLDTQHDGTVGLEVVRLQSDGALDASFGENGQVFLPIEYIYGPPIPPVPIPPDVAPPDEIGDGGAGDAPADQDQDGQSADAAVAAPAEAVSAPHVAEYLWSSAADGVARPFNSDPPIFDTVPGDLFDE